MRPASARRAAGSSLDASVRSLRRRGRLVSAAGAGVEARAGDLHDRKRLEGGVCGLGGLDEGHQSSGKRDSGGRRAK
jgi:hypothetical protein